MGNELVSIGKGRKWRPVGAEAIMAEQCQVRGPAGVVGAAAPTAALIGAEALRAGGNAFDAAVAAALAETVLLPPKCGLAGDLIALVWRAGQDAPEALLAIGGAPAGLADVAAAGGMQDTGPNAVGVPAAPAGYLALAKAGMLSLERVAAPAIQLARRGFSWSRVCSVLAEESAKLVANYNPEGTVYFPRGQVIKPGELVKLPRMARLLEEFVASQEDFLAGRVGDAIVARVQESGGVLTRHDLLSSARAEWVPAQKSDLAGMPLFVTPAPTHGPSLVAAVKDLDGGADAAAASVLRNVYAAIASRGKELADPSGTSMVSAVDGDGTMVCIVHSNSYPRFGSGLIVGEYDLILSNRAGRGYSSEPGHPNFPVAGRRPATTLHAWAVRDRDCSRYLGGTPGGANQMTWNAQTLARFAAGERDIGRLIAAPRWEWLPRDNSILAEHGFSAEEKEVLEGIAPGVDYADRWALRSAMQIVACDDGSGLARAGADPRTVGTVLAL